MLTTTLSPSASNEERAEELKCFLPKVPYALSHNFCIYLFKIDKISKYIWLLSVKSNFKENKSQIPPYGLHVE